MRHVGLVSIGSYEHIRGMVMAGHMSNEVISAFILKAFMPLVFIRTFPSSLFCKGRGSGWFSASPSSCYQWLFNFLADNLTSSVMMDVQRQNCRLPRDVAP